MDERNALPYDALIHGEDLGEPGNDWEEPEEE